MLTNGQEPHINNFKSQSGYGSDYSEKFRFNEPTAETNKKQQSFIKYFFSQSLEDTSEGDKSKGSNWNERNNNRENFSDRIKSTKATCRTDNLTKFYKIVKTPQTITKSPTYDNTNANRKRNWDSCSSSEEESPYIRKKIKCVSCVGKKSENQDIKKVLENLKEQYLKHNKNQVKQVYHSSDSVKLPETNLKKVAYEKIPSNNLERNSEKTEISHFKSALHVIEYLKHDVQNKKDSLRKCQSLESRSIPKLEESKVNSMPLTEKEYKAAENRVEDGKISFDEFMSRVLNNIQRKNESQISVSYDQGKNPKITRFINSTQENKCADEKIPLRMMLDTNPNSNLIKNNTNRDFSSSTENNKEHTIENVLELLKKGKALFDIGTKSFEALEMPQRESLDEPKDSDIGLKENTNSFKPSTIYNTDNESEESIDFVTYLTYDNCQFPSRSNTDHIEEQCSIPAKDTFDEGSKPLENHSRERSLVKPNSILNSLTIASEGETISKEEDNFRIPQAVFLQKILDEEMKKSGGEETRNLAESKESKPSEKRLSIPLIENYPNNTYPDTRRTLLKNGCDINFLEDDVIKTILTENYEKVRRRKATEADANGNTLNNLLGKCTKRISGITGHIDQQKGKERRHKCYLKRYKKGKTKIYKLKMLKNNGTDNLANDKENLNFDDLFMKMTQDFIEPAKPIARSKSASSISTTSSYMTDDTNKSDTLSTGSNELPVPQQKLRKGLNELSKNKSLYCEEEHCYYTDYDKDKIKMNIQDIFLNVFDDFTNGRKALFKMRRQCYENCTFKDGRLQFKSNSDVAISVISSGAQRSKARFKLILYILKKIQTLLETNTRLTKRELFYQLKYIISDQRVIDRAINAISCLLDVGMWALNIVAQKGLVFGNLKILMTSGETLNCNIPGTMIPQDIGEIMEIQTSAYFILVVEKESIFHKLIEEDLPNKLTRPFIMITGKGFPDLNTQLFLKRLWVVMSIPVFILVDADPHGINIMLNYRFGSVNNAHVSHHLAVPKAKWLGVFPSEIENLDIRREKCSERELKLVEDLLKTPYMVENPGIMNELKVLQTKKWKAGIEGLIKSDIFLSEVYLPTKFFSHNFI